MEITRIDHVQIAMPAGGEDRARAFYSDVLGIPEVPKPGALEGRGGAWFESGALKVHLGVDADFIPALKAHVALEVEDLAALEARLGSAGYETKAGATVNGRPRIFTFDPFGNRIELLPAP